MMSGPTLTIRAAVEETDDADIVGTLKFNKQGALELLDDIDVWLKELKEEK